MSRTIVGIALTLALAAGAAISLAGVLAPVYPPADFLNHFRPFACAGASALLVAAFALRARRAVWWGAILVGLNAILLVLPLLWSAEPAERATMGQALASIGERELKLVTFNTALIDVHPIARFLLQENPDVVLLQELRGRDAAPLRALLEDKYPHSHFCGIPHRCALAIFAKHPWIDAGHEHRSEDRPEIIWARFDHPEIGRLRVVGVHLALPFKAAMQARHIDRLIALSASASEPTIIAGDFNMTPWSYQLQRFLASSGLRRHATFLRSWPTRLYPQLRLPAPAFLIDHVITTPDIRSISIRTGPHRRLRPSAGDRAGEIAAK